MRKIFQKPIVFSALATMLVFIAVAYTSCKKDDSTASQLLDKCIGVECKNGGECSGGFCSCMDGYEGDDCSRKWSSRYTGIWQVTEEITATDNPAGKGAPLTDTIAVTLHPVVTKVNFTNFLGNDNYADMVVSIRPDSFFFEPQLLLKDSLYLTILSGQGGLDVFGNIIKGNYIRSYYNKAIKRAVNDTLKFYGERIE